MLKDESDSGRWPFFSHRPLHSSSWDSLFSPNPSLVCLSQAPFRLCSVSDGCISAKLSALRLDVKNYWSDLYRVLLLTKLQSLFTSLLRASFSSALISFLWFLWRGAPSYTSRPVLLKCSAVTSAFVRFWLSLRSKDSIPVHTPRQLKVLTLTLLTRCNLLVTRLADDYSALLNH